MNSQCQASNYPLKAFATDDNIDEANGNIINYKQLQDRIAVNYSESLLEKDIKLWPCI